ncbi:MAG: hypothetical protein P1V20_13555 [Verrucomicrobiales bacterium]|nr:hypothetical protein [Verrucomicrobiales bacterium]
MAIRREWRIKRWGKAANTARLIYIAVMLPTAIFAGNTQMLSRFDNDPNGNIEIDGLISEGGGIGHRFDSLQVDPTFTPGMISNQPLHLVVRSSEAVQLQGSGKILFAVPTDDLKEVYVGHGALPVMTGTKGLTRLNLDRPTPYFFTKGQKLFLYYITAPGLTDSSFGQLFGTGGRAVLTLLVDPAPQAPPASPAPVPREKAGNTYSRSTPPPQRKSRSHRSEPYRVVQRPLLALFTCRRSRPSMGSAKNPPSSSGCRKPLLPIRKMLSAPGKAGRNPLFCLPKCPCKKNSCPKCGRPQPLFARRTPLKNIFKSRKTRSRS